MKLPATLIRTDIDTPLGPMRLAATDGALAGAWFHDQRHAPDPALMARWRPEPAHPVLREAAAQLADYFAGRRRVFELPLELSFGTPFQTAVWRALCGIAAGRTLSYGALAQHLQAASAVRAVGAAVGRNPLSVIVPCHRVLGARGELTGYAGGLPRKQALLQLESADLPLPTPTLIPA
ncbi:MAG: methylated-DNA--[protein]-cysteine S-methyltransferase [Hydrogenophaga sp.]|uniref:methylated-DNA--[protein]-cysteine S-methyltransferase n=1 Tax=Hydrogenophaga sp. TaxID=1904254 RepID=UPI0016B89C92|nr:methylated-DNA--[protein]-cysteine S-methyltransferase [Hydrogenophaga sp.]NIM41777.1 methylated-DNA--[protein]-cysteine S-methyltransferase [Hydrogenophaga sp.]NIN27082.1 methylated-DNA--[protein]-cysteine S-methyltransferase [Hydrogenophaga sp.]NIN31783.1 methylated-DNA--[protein]-cysteine S-methyltransferase [Hydrogenophaga sp.]NIN56027.1 methylated-DNA--[protein]-cysteine S-methyltransferase [Hydrogenophaga sp.]NIO52154.1 methylated-DNA--[protein]-cysteine S-methyltransferase [Hydrogeno